MKPESHIGIGQVRWLARTALEADHPLRSQPLCLGDHKFPLWHVHDRYQVLLFGSMIWLLAGCLRQIGHGDAGQEILTMNWGETRQERLEHWDIWTVEKWVGRPW